jgi:hypothetical protein
MAITEDRVRAIFKELEAGDGASFFKHVADDVDWIVEGTHPLAGHYLSKQAFRQFSARVPGWHLDPLASNRPRPVALDRWSPTPDLIEGWASQGRRR